jgi:predicted membrane metal-binding protein
VDEKVSRYEHEQWHMETVNKRVKPDDIRRIGVDTASWNTVPQNNQQYAERLQVEYGPQFVWVYGVCHFVYEVMGLSALNEYMYPYFFRSKSQYFSVMEFVPH